MFLDSPQSGGAFVPGRPNDAPRGPNAEAKKPNQKEADKKETEDEEERKKGKPVPGVDPVEPAGGGGGGTPSKEPNFRPLTPEVPAPRVPDSVVPAPTGGGTVGGGEVVLPSGEKVKLRDDNYGPEAPPLAGEPLLPGQRDYKVVRPRSWLADSPFFYDLAYGPGASEALATAAGLGQNLTTRPGADGGRVSAFGPNAGIKTGGWKPNLGWIAPILAGAGTLARTVDTVKDNMDDPEDMVGELGDLWGHAFMDFIGYNTGKAIGGGLKKFKTRVAQSYSGDETPMSLAERDAARILGKPLPAKVFEPGTARASGPISHEQMVQAGAAFDQRSGKYTVPIKMVVTPGSPFPGGAAPSVAQVPVFEPVPNYKGGFNPLKGLSDNFKNIAQFSQQNPKTAIGAGISTVGVIAAAATKQAQTLGQLTGGQSQGDESRVTDSGAMSRSNLIGIEANDWYTRWLANRNFIFGKGKSPIEGQGLEIFKKTPNEQNLMLGGKFKEY